MTEVYMSLPVTLTLDELNEAMLNSGYVITDGDVVNIEFEGVVPSGNEAIFKISRRGEKFSDSVSVVFVTRGEDGKLYADF